MGTPYTIHCIYIMVVVLPANIHSDKDHTNTHDEEQRLESNMMLERGGGQALDNSIVSNPGSLSKQVGMVGKVEDLAQKHGYKSANIHWSNKELTSLSQISKQRNI